MSRESYDAQEELVKSWRAKLDELEFQMSIKDALGGGRMYGIPSKDMEEFQKLEDEERRKYWEERGNITKEKAEAIQSLNRIFEEDAEEAVRLHEEYSGLLEDTNTSLRKLKDFEREKLGMHQNEPEGELPNPEEDREIDEA